MKEKSIKSAIQVAVMIASFFAFTCVGLAQDTSTVTVGTIDLAKLASAQIFLNYVVPTYTWPAPEV